MNTSHLSLDRLVDYTRGELSERDDADIHAHLAECNDCARAHESERRLVDLLKAHARAEERELPPGLTTAIRARAADDRADRPRWSWHRLPASFGAFAAAGIAAVLAVAFILAFTIPRSAPSNGTVEASAYMANHAALASTMPFEDGTNAPVMLTSDEGR